MDDEQADDAEKDDDGTAEYVGDAKGNAEEYAYYSDPDELLISYARSSHVFLHHQNLEKMADCPCIPFRASV